MQNKFYSGGPFIQSPLGGLKGLVSDSSWFFTTDTFCRCHSRQCGINALHACGARTHPHLHSTPETSSTDLGLAQHGFVQTSKACLIRHSKTFHKTQARLTT
eukprot:scpid99670/ scgid17838/ 